MLEVAEDIEIDVPKIWLYLAEIVVPVIEDGVVSLDVLTKAPASIMESGKGAQLLAEVLKLSEKIMVSCGIISLRAYFVIVSFDILHLYCSQTLAHMYDNNMCLLSPQGSGQVTVLWTSSTVSYSSFKIMNVEEFKKKYVSSVM